MLRRLLKSSKPTVLGRWSINTDTAIRRAELAHCDNCGTCSIPEEKEYIQETQEKITTMLIVDDDIIDFTYAPGSFHLHAFN